MLRKSITYKNLFTDEDVTEEHFFHLSKADVVRLQMEDHGITYRAKDGETYTGTQARLKKIMDSGDGQAIIEEMEEFIRRSYGKKIGDNFVKNDKVWHEFASSEAYSEMLYELCTNAAAGAEFMNGIIPGEMAREAAAEIAAAQAQADGAAATSQGSTPETPSAPTVVEPITLTAKGVAEMDANELKSGLAAGRYKLS